MNANGSTLTPTCRAMTMTTGVRRTAVVSSERKTVLATARATTMSHSNHVRPRAHRVECSAIQLNSPASEASSVTIVMATTNRRMGQTRSQRVIASSAGRMPVNNATAPSAMRPAPMMAVRIRSPARRPRRGTSVTQARRRPLPPEIA